MGTSRTRRTGKQYYEVIKVLSEFFDKVTDIDYCSTHKDEECKNVQPLSVVLDNLKSEFDELEVLVEEPKPTNSVYIMRKGNIVAIADPGWLEAYIYVMSSEKRAQQLMHIIREICEFFSHKDIYLRGIHELIADHMDYSDEITEDNIVYNVATERG